MGDEVEVDVERDPWERRDGETSRAWRAFRVFRDLGMLRSIEQAADALGMNPSAVQQMSTRHGWRERAESWDDECARVEDRARLAAIAEMHRAHSEAGKLARTLALEALRGTPADVIPPHAAVRLLDVGTRLERSTLLTSVAEMQGRDAAIDDGEDPWEAIARELQGS